MAQLEVPPPDSRGRHDLRPVDADPEAASNRRRPDFDRRVEGGRAHGRRHALRRGRGGSEGEAPSGLEGPGPGTRPGSARGTGWARRTSSAAPAPAPATRWTQWAGPRDTRRRSPARTSRQAGKSRRGAKTTQAAPPGDRISASRRGAGGSAGPCPRTGAGGDGGRYARGSAGRPGPRHPPPAVGKPPGLSGDFQRLQVLDHPPGELSWRRGAAGHTDLPGAGEPAEIQVFEPVDQVSRLLAELLDNLDQPERVG